MTSKKEYLDFQDVYDLVKDLSKSQGFYGRMLAEIQGMDEDELTDLKNGIIECKFKEPLDFILYVEG